VTIFTLGLLGNFGGGTTQTAQPSDGEYRDAPIAFKLRKAMPDAECRPLDMGGRGQSCQAFFVVDPQVDVPVKLVVGTPTRPTAATTTTGTRARSQPSRASASALRAKSGKGPRLSSARGRAGWTRWPTR
jgi:hypothetical protein